MSDFSNIALVGTGIMGRGIAQLFAQSGHTVLLFDAKPGAAEAARAAVVETFGRLAEKGKLSTEARDAAAARLRPVAALSDLAGCGLVIEAIVEKLEAKQALFRELEAVVAPEVVLASNTSSLSITAIAAACTRPERAVGLHFFNPVPLMKLCEVVPGLRTAPDLVPQLTALIAATGHAPIVAKDAPGFVVNHLSRAFVTESLRILAENVATPAGIDLILREQCGFRLGPFEFLDLTGLDVSQPVMEGLYHSYFEEPRYRPSWQTAQRLAGGLLGRKSGEGFYRYAEGKPVPLAESGEAPAGVLPAGYDGSVWIAPGHGRDVLAAALANAGIAVSNDAAPPDGSLPLVLPLGRDATSEVVAQGLDATRTLAVDGLGGWDRRLVVMTTPASTAEAVTAARIVLQRLAPLSVIHDSGGFIAQRVLAMIVSLGCDLAQQGIASPADVDRAARLGLNYPAGPFEWGDRLGARNVLAILEALLAATGDPRYRPSPWLRRRAQLGLPLAVEEVR